MIKLITPPGMLLTTALLVIYSAYAFMIGWIEDSWPLRLGGGFAVVATYGVAMLRPWSRHLVYLLTAGFFAKLGHSVWHAHRVGFFDFQFGSTHEAISSLASSTMMGLLSLLCCYLVSRYFSEQRRRNSRLASATDADLD